MRIIDARSGKDNLRVGDVIKYPPVTDQSGEPLEGHAGEWWELLEVRDRWFWASVRIRQPGGEQWVALSVRFLHPAFFFQRVAFFPS